MQILCDSKVNKDKLHVLYNTIVFIIIVSIISNIQHAPIPSTKK